MAQPSTRRRAADLVAFNACSPLAARLPATPRGGVSVPVSVNACGAVAQPSNAAAACSRRCQLGLRPPPSTRLDHTRDSALNAATAQAAVALNARPHVPFNAAAVPAPALPNAAWRLSATTPPTPLGVLLILNSWPFSSRCSTPLLLSIETPSTRLQLPFNSARLGYWPSPQRQRGPPICSTPGSRRYLLNDEPLSDCHSTPIDGRLTPSTPLLLFLRTCFQGPGRAAILTPCQRRSTSYCSQRPCFTWPLLNTASTRASLQRSGGFHRLGSSSSGPCMYSVPGRTSSPALVFRQRRDSGGRLGSRFPT